MSRALGVGQFSNFRAAASVSDVPGCVVAALFSDFPPHPFGRFPEASLSCAVGVGQDCAAAWRSPPPESSRPSSCFRSADSPPPVIVLGVGHCSISARPDFENSFPSGPFPAWKPKGVDHAPACALSGIPPWAVFVFPRSVSEATGVDHAVPLDGEDEESLPPVRGTHVGRSNSDPLRIEPELGKIGEDNVETSPSECSNVLGEDAPGAGLVDDPLVLGPEAAALPGFDPRALARVGDVLAGEAANDEIHEATPWATIEGGNVVPDRSAIQRLVFHPCHEGGRGVSVPLDITHGAIGSSEDKTNAPLETGKTGE